MKKSLKNALIYGITGAFLTFLLLSDVHFITSDFAWRTEEEELKNPEIGWDDDRETFYQVYNPEPYDSGGVAYKCYEVHEKNVRYVYLPIGEEDWSTMAVLKSEYNAWGRMFNKYVSELWINVSNYLWGELKYATMATRSN